MGSECLHELHIVCLRRQEVFWFREARGRRYAAASVPGLHPKRMDEAREVAQQGKEDVEDEGPAKAFADKHA